MPRGARYISFEGQFENGVLGTFRIIRGFANLKDLAEISVAYDMEDGDGDGRVKGQQRKIDPQHAERIRQYLEKGGHRFLPEVILSIRTPLTETALGVESAGGDDGLVIGRPWKSRKIRVHRVRVDRKKLDEIKAKKLIRRLDGNHRLALADKLTVDPLSPKKYLAPFCIVLLGPTDEAADDYSESLIFHTINSTAMPLESEHALRLILGQHPDYDMTPAKEFSFSPDLHLTRILRDGFLALSEPAQSRLGQRPLTSLRSAARGILDLTPDLTRDIEALRKYGRDLLAALDDIITRLEPKHSTFCAADFFIELAARIWKNTPSGTGHAARVNSAVLSLEKLALWLGKDGLVGLRENQSLSKQILDIFGVVGSRIPKKVFLARWYPTLKDGKEFKKAKLRLEQIKRALKEIGEETGSHLELVDMGTKTGSTFPIHAKMYEAIMSSDIILVDLTGVRPNVCIEAGYALRNHEKNRLIFLFQPGAKNPEVPFDLKTFRYDPIDDSGEIPEKIKPHIRAILDSASVGS